MTDPPDRPDSVAAFRLAGHADTDARSSKSLEVNVSGQLAGRHIKATGHHGMRTQTHPAIM
jgi:hypothetical protein